MLQHRLRAVPFGFGRSTRRRMWHALEPQRCAILVYDTRPTRADQKPHFELPLADATITTTRPEELVVRCASNK